MEKRPDLPSLGAFVRDRRLELGLTQTQLAARTGWVQERISVLERGRYGLPSVPLLARLAHALDVPLGDLLSAAGFPPHGEDTEDKERRADPAGMLYVLTQLLRIETGSIEELLRQVANLLIDALGGEKFDAFVVDGTGSALVALGTSDSPLGRLQRKLGLHILPLTDGGRAAQVFLTGVPYFRGDVENDEEELLGIREDLGIRSAIMTPLDIAGERRGVLSATSAQANRFSLDDLQFLEAVRHWIATLVHRAELVTLVTRDASETARKVAAEELMSIVAHDVGNLLTPLQGRISVVKRRARKEERETDLRDLDEALRSIDRTRRLVTDLLDASRLDSSSLQLFRQSTDLVALAHEVANDFKGQHERIEILHDDEVAASVDTERVRQVLWNLVGNAVRHSPPEAPVTIHVTSVRRQGGSWAVVHVQDRGPGVAPELAPVVFDRFARGPDSNGLGLGLFVARAVVESHGGSLSVESTPGAGARFTVALPA